MGEPAGVERRAIYARVTGRVQGVGYRISAVDEAAGLGLVGYVRNRWDGSVEVVAEGPPEALNRFVSWLHAGPPFARVERVDWHWQEPTSEYHRFEVR